MRLPWLLSFVALGCVVVASAVAGLAAWRTHAAACSSTNKALSVLQGVLGESFAGPHHFNDPADQAARLKVYQRQLAQIMEARCR